MPLSSGSSSLFWCHCNFSAIHLLLFSLSTFRGFHVAIASWDDWWTYDGISGTEFWGLLNPDWTMCNSGRRQSPINIEPSNLLFDPDLRPIRIDADRVSGLLENNGHSIMFHVQDDSVPHYSLTPMDDSSPPPHLPAPAFFSSDSLSSQTGISLRSNPLRPFRTSSSSLSSPQSSNPIFPAPSSSSNVVTVTGGPLSYTYRVQYLQLHFGRTDMHGSEHIVAGVSFPAELQIIGFNSDLYQNMSDASTKANGLVGVALLIQLGNTSNSELRALTSLAHNIRFRGQNASIKSFSIRDLVPDLEFYMTYEGSLTTPACTETVTWIIINKPIFVTRQQLLSLRKLMQGDPSSPKAPLGNNFRPSQPLNHRVVRTNIDFRNKKGSTGECPSMKARMQYQMNARHLKM